MYYAIVSGCNSSQCNLRYSAGDGIARGENARTGVCRRFGCALYGMAWTARPMAFKPFILFVHQMRVDLFVCFFLCLPLFRQDSSSILLRV